VFADMPKPNYEYVNDPELAKRIVFELNKHEILYVDVEATALDAYEAKISLIQIGIPNKAYVFDVRHDTEHSSLNAEIILTLLKDETKLKVLQNATYDMKLFKVNYGFYLKNVYDTMLVEQLLTLGLHSKASLDYLVNKYLGLKMEKQTRGTFTDYYQKFKTYQLEYAANDVLVLPEIRNLQLPLIKKHSFEDACRLEFEFTKPLCEMELNGISLDVDKWRIIMEEVELERNSIESKINDMLIPLEDQMTLFGISLIDIDSPAQLKKALNDLGFNLPNTDVKELSKHKNSPIISDILNYRKLSKLITTYGEPLLERMHKITGRLHTSFKQMVATGRMSSANPNLQNIPKQQKYRSCFIAKRGYKLITSDMAGAELRILGNLSEDPIFVESYRNGIDLHTKAASEVFEVSMDEVTKEMRDNTKAIQFGIIYGLSKFGLSTRLKITEEHAQELIDRYFNKYRKVKRYLDESAKEGVYKRYSRSIAGRKRFYALPDYSDPNFNRIKSSIERQSKNMPIQSSNADTIKQSMIYCVERLEENGYDAKLLLTVHDEMVVEVVEEQAHDVKKLVDQSLIDGFGHYFDLIPMEADGLIGPCWLKNECKQCGHFEMKCAKDNKYGTKIVCAKCGKENS
jgi:DNA polymerase I-like protein with 3'-5' exonuclease and polymerase domains